MSDDQQQEAPGTSASGPSREELDARAIALGIASPEKLRTKELVEEAIADAEAEPRFSRDEVLANARLITGYSANHMSGALFGVEQESFTKAQATHLGKEFATHEQETDA